MPETRSVARTTKAATSGLPYRLATAGPASAAACLPGRHSGTFHEPQQSRRYWGLLAALGALAVLVTFAILSWNNPMPFGSEGYWRIARMRATSLVVIAIVTTCQGVATIAFHTVTANRIITPSIMGFEALYRLIHTSSVFFLGAAGVTAFAGTTHFLLQTALMVAVSAALYGWLLRNTAENIHVMLLVGIVLGGGLASLSTFMQRMLDPSTFDILTARLFGNISNADPSLLPIVIPVVAVTSALLVGSSRRLNVLALGRQTAINLGISHTRDTMMVLLAVSVLMAMTTTLVGPMTFLGFLIATLAYQLTQTFDHRLIFPVALLVGYVIMSSAYFIMRHIFSAQGSVTVIIELIGGLTFLFFIVRKGRL